jgi:hypothetical protein
MPWRRRALRAAWPSFSWVGHEYVRLGRRSPGSGMSTFAFCSLVSPGVTTSVLAMAHQWPVERPVTVVDCAPAGGMIAQRLGFEPDSGLATMAAQVRTGALSGSVIRQSAVRAGEVMVVGAPTSGRSVVAALARLGLDMVDALGELAGDVLIDCGRIFPHSPAMPIIRRAGRVILVSRATHTELDRVRADAKPTIGEATPVELLLIGEPGWRWPRAQAADGRHHHAAEVAEKLGLPVAAVLGHDPRGAARVGHDSWWLDRSYLVRSARDAVAELCDGMSNEVPADARPVKADVRAG